MRPLRKHELIVIPKPHAQLPIDSTWNWTHATSLEHRESEVTVVKLTFCDQRYWPLESMNWYYTTKFIKPRGAEWTRLSLPPALAFVTSRHHRSLICVHRICGVLCWSSHKVESTAGATEASCRTTRTRKTALRPRKNRAEKAESITTLQASRVRILKQSVQTLPSSIQVTSVLT